MRYVRYARERSQLVGSLRKERLLSNDVKELVKIDEALSNAAKNMGDYVKEPTKKAKGSSSCCRLLAFTLTLSVLIGAHGKFE